MGNHEILFPALQKYYSALKSLYDFGRLGDFFDDVSNMDKFFSEFRNITFVVQKSTKTEEDKAVYSHLQQKYLSGNKMKWFVEERNKTTKEKPFGLKKELCINLYFLNGVIRLKDPRMIVNINDSFDNALAFIKETFINSHAREIVYFSTEILFYESGSNIDLLPNIKYGLNQMNGFMGEIASHFHCKCAYCSELMNKANDLFSKLQFQELFFSNDYTLEKDKEPVQGDTVGMYLSVDNKGMVPISALRSSLDNMFYAETKGCIRQLFLKFISLHVLSYQMQDHQIMPAFMLIYSNQTYRMIPFVATTKATFYHKMWDVIELPDFDEVVAVFLCCEYYCCDMAPELNMDEKSFLVNDTADKHEVLAFTMLEKDHDEKEVFFDAQYIDKKEYVEEQIREFVGTKGTIMSFNWLNPLRHALYSHVTEEND